jgi:signal transduction histidine kinase/CheY-like chemotaxis protein
MAVPLSIGRHLRGLLVAQAHPCLFHLDRDLRITAITGDRERYRISDAAIGDDVRALLPVMHGYDLTSEERWPMVEVVDGVYADVLIRPIAGGAHLLLTDVTREHAERQAVQQHANEVHLLNSKLHRSLEELEAARAELEARNRELDALNRIKTRFIAGLSHELRTPLTAIIGHSELLRERCGRQGTELEESLRAIESGSGYLMSLVNNVLDQASLETGQLAIHPAPTDLAVLLEETAAMLRPMAERRDLDFRYHPAAGLPEWVETDATRLRQVVINLANNAIKYTEQGFVELNADWRQGRLRLRVADSGPGIAPEQRERIMLPFQRGEKTGKQSGVGLGLAISLQIIELLGGELTIGDRDGGGAVFQLEMPLAAISHRPAAVAAGKPGAAAMPRAALPPSRLPVLLVEDSPGIRILYRHVVKSLGHPVDEATDAESVRQHFAAAEPAIVIVDLNLGDSDGADLVRELRDSGYRGLIIGWSASSLRDDQERMVAAGADAYLVKPVPPPVLKETLRELLQAQTQATAGR